jgi:hypothetical protein
MQQRTRRSGITIGLLSLGVLAGVALTASPAQAASGPGPYYAKPAWDRNMVTSNRFLVLTNWNSEAVLDKETGLVWEKAPDATAMIWSDARGACTARTIGNRKGWRLPSVFELASLVHPLHTNPALPTGHPFVILALSPMYWSATTNAEFSTVAWGVLLDQGLVSGGLKDGPGLAWCVRGGMNADTY